MTKIEKTNIPPKFRYERKFVLENRDEAYLLNLIRQHPMFFRPIYSPRQINNIYFDTHNLRAYLDNQIGIPERKKHRIRWYGPLTEKIDAPQLEVKIKHGLIGDKWTFPLPDFTLQPHHTLLDFHALFQTANIPSTVLEEMLSLRPALLNTYQRSYFQSADKHFRLTLDQSFSYHTVWPMYRPSLLRSPSEQYTLLELKYQPKYDNIAERVSSSFPNRLDKHSKYVNGIDFLKGNAFL